MRSTFHSTLIGVAALAASAFTPGVASACGGFFCNQSQPVNQAAEGIIFADNGDGTVTAVIQIQYQGSAADFSWLLPISEVNDIHAIGVASNLALRRLQTATNPNYTLNTRVEGTCKQDDSFGARQSSGGASSGGAPGVAVGGSNSGVTVTASGVVGPYDTVVLKLDASLADPADTAIAWLTANQYFVPPGAGKLIGSYLKDGLSLIALRLTKGADTGSIRPLVVTYPGTQASIPIKLTAVAANDDMGVLTWLLGEGRAVPENYKSLELNEARINWFNASSNYNAVTIEAANDAGGQGFVTEFAGASSTFQGVVWTAQDDASWANFQNTQYQSFRQFFDQAYALYGQYDGFWDATTAAMITLPASVSFADFKLCPNCYAGQIQLTSLSGYVAALQTNVIDPMRLVQNLIDAHPKLTRLYTTLSAPEMTLDPLFTFNPDLPEVSNLHTADRVIECSPSIFQSEAPWRIELPQGGVVRGTAAQVGTWPDQLTMLPPNLRILQVSGSGSGKVLEDNTSAISSALSSYNAKNPGSANSADGGCSFSSGRAPAPASGFWVLTALGAILARRRRS